MISEKQFSRYSSSTWRFLAPTMEIYVRRINLNLYEREFSPLTSTTSPSRRGFINEIAFQLFCRTANGRSFNEQQQEEAAIISARVNLSRLKGTSQESDTTAPTNEEMFDVRQQLSRLEVFFGKQSAKGSLEFSPNFAGCGIVDASNGDVYFDGTLFEIKAGDRNFRSIDLRQILTYAALNYAKPGRPLRRVGLFNPRMGISFSAPLDEICLEVSGYPASHTLAEIVRVISNGDISR